MKKIKVGVIVADGNEFYSIRKVREFGVSLLYKKYHEYDCMWFEYAIGERYIRVDFILSGIGLTNAAGLAGMMIADKYDYILNAGLSGAISSVRRDDTVICDKYYEHDFDITRLGFKPGVKGSESSSEFFSDPVLLDHFKKYIPTATTGTAVSGNIFVANSKKKEWIKSTFSALCCDMESAGIAAVCNKNKIPFLSVRRISDTADDVAKDSYKSYSVGMTAPLFSCMVIAIVSMINNDVFWDDSGEA